MEKEEIFEIMGKYYGNAYYRDKSLTSEEALIIKNTLDKINALGYYFSNLGRLADVKDDRFIDILIETYKKYEKEISKGLKLSLLRGLHFKGYDVAIPFLLEVYHSKQSRDDFDFKFSISSIIENIFSKKYIKNYVDIIMSDEYKQADCIYSMLCKMKEESAYKRIIELVESYPDEFKFSFLKDAWKYKRVELVEYFSTFLGDSRSEICTMAKNAIKKVKKSNK